MFTRWNRVVWIGFGDSLFGQVVGRVVKHDFTDNTHLICWKIHLFEWEGVPRKWKYHSSWVYSDQIIPANRQ